MKRMPGGGGMAAAIVMLVLLLSAPTRAFAAAAQEQPSEETQQPAAEQPDRQEPSEGAGTSPSDESADDTAPAQPDATRPDAPQAAGDFAPRIVEPGDGKIVQPDQTVRFAGIGCRPGTAVAVRASQGTFFENRKVTADGDGGFATSFRIGRPVEPGQERFTVQVSCNGRSDRVTLAVARPPAGDLEIIEPTDGTRVRPGQLLTVRGRGCEARARVRETLRISTFSTTFDATADADGEFATTVRLPGTFEGDRDGEISVVCGGRRDRVGLVLDERRRALEITEPDDGTRVEPGQRLEVRGQGCDPEARIRGELRISTFTYEFKAVADGDGDFALRITLPKTFEGDRDGELRIRCSGRSDEVRLVLDEEDGGSDDGGGNGNGDGSGDRRVPKGGVQTGAGGTASPSDGGLATGLAAAAALLALGAGGVVSARRRGARGFAAALVLSTVLVLTACRASGPGAGPAASEPSPGTAAPAPPAPAAERLALLASEPTRIEVPSIGVDARIVTLGLNPDGTMEVPRDFTVAGWYRYLPTPGERGPAIVTGHIDSKSGPAVFYRLRALQPGAEIRVTRADDTVAVFRVDRLEQYPKAQFPTDRVYGDIDHAGLRLITCGGSFDRSIGHYRDNIIAYATLTATS